MNISYYFINDLSIIAKIEDRIPYLYEKGKGWVVDNNNIVYDRLIGYDGDTIGSSDMLFRIDQIAEDEVIKLISEM